MTKSISVVIPNYNGIELLRDNIPYLYQSLQTSEINDFEIIVADDASTDHSVRFLEMNYPEIIIIKNTKNKGFAGNTNTGIRAAQKQLIFILNSDVQMSEHYFVPLMRYFEKEDTFAVMGRIIGLSTNEIQDSAKYPAYSFAEIISTQNYISKERNSLYTLFISGANTLADREKLLFIGGFNEIFNPYYAEDVDLGLNAWRFGYKLYYENEAFCRHPNSSTIKKEPSEKVQIITKRNKMFLHYLQFDGAELWFFLIKIMAKTFFRTLLADTKYLRATVLFFKSIQKLEVYKKSIQHKKVKKLSEVIKFIKDDIGKGKIIKF